MGIPIWIERLLQATKVDTAAILALITGGGADARFQQSAAGVVEAGSYIDFNISIYDVNFGAVLVADIDIGAISVLLEQSRAGAAFSAAGITQPVFAAIDGRVYCQFKFLATEWEAGDVYRLIVSDVRAIVDLVPVYVPAMVWSNEVVEAASAEAMIAKVWKQVLSPDVNITAILASETDVLNLPAAANTTYMLNHLRLKSADPGVNTVLVRLYEEENGALTNVGTFTIGTTGYINDFADYFSLMDMFSLAHCAGNNIKVTVQASGGGPYAVTAQYQYATATV
jgi:hypothetical protein